MAHYALLQQHPENENILIVVDTITGVNEDDTTNLPSEFNSWEEFYGDQLNLICKRYSYNTKGGLHINGGTPFRGNSAGISDWYDIENDVFYGEKPYDSYILNTTTWSWEPPIPYPDDTNLYIWDENVYNADTNVPKIEGWVLQS